MGEKRGDSVKKSNWKWWYGQLGHQKQKCIYNILHIPFQIYWFFSLSGRIKCGIKDVYMSETNLYITLRGYSTTKWFNEMPKMFDVWCLLSHAMLSVCLSCPCYFNLSNYSLYIHTYYTEHVSGVNQPPLSSSSLSTLPPYNYVLFVLFIILFSHFFSSYFLAIHSFSWSYYAGLLAADGLTNIIPTIHPTNYPFSAGQATTRTEQKE